MTQRKKENHLTVPSYEECFPHLVEHFDGIYEDLSTAELAPECSGTKSQNHSNIEHVVFLGDSVTVGTYPTEVDGFTVPFSLKNSLIITISITRKRLV